MTTAAQTLLDENGPAFVTACCTGQMDEVLQTIANHPDIVNWTNPARGDRTALIEMTISGKEFDIAQVLIEHGANPNLQDDTGQTALHHFMYITSGDLRFIKLLVDAGTDETITQRDGHDILKFAKMTSLPPYKEALNEALEARATTRAAQASQAELEQDMRDEALAMVTVRRIETMHSRRANDGGKFKL